MARMKQTNPKRRVATVTKMEKKAGGRRAKLGKGGDEPAAAGGKKERKYRFKPGTVALREIRRFQKSVDVLIPKAPLRRLIREVAAPYKDDLRFSGPALDALQQASEAYVTDLFADANECAIQHDRVTVEPKDMRLAMKMRHDHTLPQLTTLPENVRRKVVPSKRRARKSKQASADADKTAQSNEAGAEEEPVEMTASQPPSF